MTLIAITLRAAKLLQKGVTKPCPSITPYSPCNWVSASSMWQCNHPLCSQVTAERCHKTLPLTYKKQVVFLLQFLFAGDTMKSVTWSGRWSSKFLKGTGTNNFGLRGVTPSKTHRFGLICFLPLENLATFFITYAYWRIFRVPIKLLVRWYTRQTRRWLISINDQCVWRARKFATRLLHACIYCVPFTCMLLLLCIAQFRHDVGGWPFWLFKGRVWHLKREEIQTDVGTGLTFGFFCLIRPHVRRTW